MKRQFSFLGVVFALLATLSCGTPYIATNPEPPSALLTVECRSASVQQIMQLLRSARAKDIRTITDPGGQKITAAFTPADTPPSMLAHIVQLIHDLDGVISVDLAENHQAVRENF
jgi:hypothetical protein